MTSTGNRRVVHPRSSLRLTRRGRAVLVALLALLVLASFWLGTWRGGATALAADARPAHRSVVLEPGDTLWEVAQRLDPNADPRILVHRIMELNNLSTAYVGAGQRIAVPRVR